MATEGTLLRLRELALIEDASPDNVVTLTPVTEGVDGSALFGVTNEAGDPLQLGNGQLYLNRTNPSLAVVCLKPDSSDVTQIESWVDNQTDIYASGITLDGGFLIGDKQTTTGLVKLVANEQLSDNDVYAFNIQKQATLGFDPSTGIYQNGFWVGKNLIGGYKWADADGDGIADGWGEIGGSFNTTTFSSGQQTLEVDGDAARLGREIYLPFEGEEITFSITVDTFNSIDTFQIRILEIDTSDSTISTSTTNVSSTGRKSVTATLSTGSSLSSVICDIRLSNTTTGTTVSEVISDPALKLGTDSTYSTF